MINSKSQLDLSLFWDLWTFLSYVKVSNQKSKYSWYQIRFPFLSLSSFLYHIPYRSIKIMTSSMFSRVYSNPSRRSGSSIFENRLYILFMQQTWWRHFRFLLLLFNCGVVISNLIPPWLEIVKDQDSIREIAFQVDMNITNFKIFFFLENFRARDIW